MAPDYSTLDAALGQLAPYGPDLANGFTSHAPMVVEALAVLGRAKAALPWIDAHRDTFLPRPAPRAPIAADDWVNALGQPDRAGDWSVRFAGELAAAPWRTVLARWTMRLAPGLCASAFHGVIRVGHAARSLAAGESPPRLQELADALASWAAYYQTLPTATGTEAPRAAAGALAAVAVVPPAQRRFDGTIVGSLAALADWPAFAPAIDLLDVAPEPAAVISDLTDLFARVFLTNARDVLSAVTFVHGITGPAALRPLLPVLAPGEQREAVRRAWQAAAGLYAAFATAPPAGDPVDAPRESPEVSVDRAVATGDDHAIKLAAAALGEHALRPSPAYLAAIRLAAELLAPG